MATREAIATKYNRQYRELHEEFFETINEGTPEQERRLKLDQSSEEFNRRFAEITQSYEAELAANGYPGLNPPVEEPRDLLAEIDSLRTRVEKLERR